MSTYSPETSPRAPSPSNIRKNRRTDRSSYIQRWKVLQDRNRNLPKIDFGVKAQIVPKVGRDQLWINSMVSKCSILRSRIAFLFNNYTHMMSNLNF